MDEKRIIAGLRKGSEKAVAALLRRHGDTLLRGAYLLLGDYQLAEDVVQETVLAALRSIDQFKGEAKLGTWLYSIAVNQCRMLLRKRQPSLLSELPELEANEDVEAVVLEAEAGEELSQVLAKLAYHYREALVLYYYQDMSVAEISRSVGCPEGTVKARLARGRKQVERHLGRRNACAQVRR